MKWSLKKQKKEQNIFKSNLNKISRGRSKPGEQESASKNIKLPNELQKVVLKLFNDYSSIVSEAKHKAKHGKGLKLLIPKQMLQRLPIALAQVKADNAYENSLNEIREIRYSLYRAKKLLKNI